MEQAQWDGIGRAATVAQLVGVDALGLISMIVQAAQAVHRNKESCQELVQDVQLIGGLLQMLEDPEMRQRVQIINALKGLQGTLQEAQRLVNSCQDCSVAFRIFMGWKQTDKFRRVNKKIAKHLRVYPMVSHADITRRLERLGNGAQSTCSSQEIEEVVRSSVGHSNPEVRTEGTSFDGIESVGLPAATEPLAVEENQQDGYSTVMAADVGGLISMILRAAVTARQNKECEQLARRVFMIAELLPLLQDPEVMRRPEVWRPLTGLGDTLREAHELVTSCQERSAAYRFVTAGRQADRFNDVQSRIDSYLIVFPIISHIDITRRLDRIYNILLPNDTSVPSAGSQSQLGPAEVAQQVVPPPHGGGAVEFTLAELAAATNNFALDTVIGRGGYGTVYKGRLPDGREVAIKRMFSRSWISQHGEEMFRNELAILSPLHHKHIVRLFGWSVQKEGRRLPSFRKKEEERLLVYEYMSNGTLHDHLDRQTSSSSPLMASWKMRIQILLGVSRAIEYLHCYAVPPVIHLDIKPHNVLLDASWVPRVSDFGLSATYDVANEVPAPLCGTIGYMAPDCFLRGLLRPAIDVYSFGAVTLEVLTGKRNIDTWEDSEAITNGEDSAVGDLAGFVLARIEAGELGKVLDRRPAAEPTPRQLQAAELVAHTAARCLRLQGEDRPAMSDVVADLETALELVRCDE